MGNQERQVLSGEVLDPGDEDEFVELVETHDEAEFRRTRQTNAGGRPRKHIDWKSVNEMLKIQCTGEEIAAVLGISYKTLQTACLRTFGMGFVHYSDAVSSGWQDELASRSIQSRNVW